MKCSQNALISSKDELSNFLQGVEVLVFVIRLLLNFNLISIGLFIFPQ